MGYPVTTDGRHSPPTRPPGPASFRLLRPRSPGGTGELFTHLIASGDQSAKRGERLRGAWGLSGAVHFVAVVSLILSSAFWPETIPTPPDAIHVLLRGPLRIDPPPPPPPPLPKGSPFGLRRSPAKAALPSTAPSPAPEPTPAKLQAPVEEPAPLEPPRPEAGTKALEAFGSPTGSDFGGPDGVEGGVEGGVVGGVLGGVVGGVLGGAGQGPVPVLDYDRPPRRLRETTPRYPHEAFVRKIEGTVVVEFLIDATGRVAWARVVQSLPLLDEAATACVRLWVFSPALRRGQPVPTLARAPVTFRIY